MRILCMKTSYAVHGHAEKCVPQMYVFLLVASWSECISQPLTPSLWTFIFQLQLRFSNTCVTESKLTTQRGHSSPSHFSFSYQSQLCQNDTMRRFQKNAESGDRGELVLRDTQTCHRLLCPIESVLRAPGMLTFLLVFALSIAYDDDNMCCIVSMGTSLRTKTVRKCVDRQVGMCLRIRLQTEE